MAEQSGLMHAIDQWALKAACDELGRWSRESANDALKLAVNVSAVRLHASGFVASVRHALEPSGAPANRLELTQMLLLQDVDAAADKMRALKALGVGFAIDDFGTGYSALAYLTSLPFDRLKIDKSIVVALRESRNGAAVTQTIINMARSLGLEVIAEGVEIPAQHDSLIHAGCLAYQGFLFSRPLAPGAFLALRHAHRSGPTQPQ